jgi:hypothetical protein
MPELRLTVRTFMPRQGLRSRLRRWLASLIEPKGGWARQIPEKWEDLTRENLLFLAEFYPYPIAYAVLNASGRGMDLTGRTKLYEDKTKARRFLTYLFVHFFKVRKNLRLSIWIYIYLKGDELFQILYTNVDKQRFLFSFLFEPPNGKSVLIPNFTHARKTYYGPATGWMNMTNDEFDLADGCFVRYIKEPDPDTLLLLISAIYRPIEQGSNRPTFDRLQVDANKAALKGMDEKLQSAILLNYMMVRNYIINANPHVFKNGSSGSAKRNGWGAVVISMAKSQTEMTDLRNAFIWDTFKWLGEVRKK